MTRTLPNSPSISLLKKQAKKLLKQFHDGEPHALASVRTHHPKPEAFAGLRDAQLVIARSYDFQGWSDLSEAVELAQDFDKSLPDKAALFIQLGCMQYNGNDTLRNYQRARKLLAAVPDISEFSFYTALVANNAKAVATYLESDSSLAVTPGGPLDWRPLMYALYSRVGEPEDTQHSLLIVKQLLEHGADPDTHIILNDTYRFTALTGAMGEGEQGVNQPPHQYADAMAALLLEAGANPNDGQGLYNTMFTDSGDKWLSVLLSRGLNANAPLNWQDSDHDVPVTTLDYQLASAVDSNRQARVQMLLDAGANPNTCNTYNNRAIHTNALLAGHATVALLLEEKGAIAEQLDFKDQFQLACVREDHASISTLLDTHPSLTEDATLLHAAAEHASLQVVKTLIARGFDINGQSKHGRTLLHHFALINDSENIRVLLDLGARADLRDGSYHSLPSGFAAYSGSYEAMRLLLDASDSLLDAVSCAYLDRAKVLVEINPASLHDRTEQGNTLLHVIGYWLHDEPEYEVYKSLVEWLISVGADINAKNKQEQSPLQFHIANGSDTLAELLADYS
ncbi:MAG: ankyrin repeat domain-containing protein [Granulosicoccus sp.]